VRRGSLAFRDRSSSSPPGFTCPIASSNSAAGTELYVTAKSCRQHLADVRMNEVCEALDVAVDCGG